MRRTIDARLGGKPTVVREEEGVDGGEPQQIAAVHASHGESTGMLGLVQPVEMAVAPLEVFVGIRDRPGRVSTVSGMPAVLGTPRDTMPNPAHLTVHVGPRAVPVLRDLEVAPFVGLSGERDVEEALQHPVLGQRLLVSVDVIAELEVERCRMVPPGIRLSRPGGCHDERHAEDPQKNHHCLPAHRLLLGPVDPNLPATVAPNARARTGVPNAALGRGCAGTRDRLRDVRRA